jgi:tetratricopeptide (TPR) repeat protein
MTKQKSHKWTFAARFRTNAYGWGGSRLACQRIKEAVSEIKKVTRKDPLLGAEGAIRLMEKLWPALQHVDSSSGALGTAVYNAMGVLVDVVVTAPADAKTRAKWLDRLWVAFNDDGVGFLDVLGERWGDVCGSPKIASRWADELLPVVKTTWDETRKGAFSVFRGDGACLSCLLVAGRYQELLDLIELAPHISWYNRKYGIRALVAMGQKGEAIKYAKASCGLNDHPIVIDQVCEEILISSGRYEEAYQQYGLTANRGGTNLATFRNIVKKYPMKEKTQILEDLIESTPGEEGKWFATAKSIGLLALALKLAYQSPCDPRTLNRAARDFLEKEPEFALGVAMASLNWMLQGWGYEITGADVFAAYNYAMTSAEKLGKEKQVRRDIIDLVENDQSPGMFVKGILERYLRQ